MRITVKQQSINHAFLNLALLFVGVRGFLGIFGYSKQTKSYISRPGIPLEKRGLLNWKSNWIRSLFFRLQERVHACLSRITCILHIFDIIL